MKLTNFSGTSALFSLALFALTIIGCSGPETIEYSEGSSTSYNKGEINALLLQDGYVVCYDINDNGACDANEPSTSISSYSFSEPATGTRNAGSQETALIAVKDGLPTHYAVNKKFSPLNTIIYTTKLNKGKSEKELFESIAGKLGYDLEGIISSQGSFLDLQQFVSYALSAGVESANSILSAYTPESQTSANTLTVKSLRTAATSAPVMKQVGPMIFDKIEQNKNLGSLIKAFNTKSNSEKERLAKSVTRLDESEMLQELLTANKKPSQIALSITSGETSQGVAANSATVEGTWNLWWGKKGTHYIVELNEIIESRNPLTYTEDLGSQSGSFTVTLKDNRINVLKVSLCYKDPSTDAETCTSAFRKIKTGTAVNANKQPGVPSINWIPSTISESPIQVKWNMWWGVNGNRWELKMRDDSTSPACSGTLVVDTSNSGQSGSCEISLVEGINTFYVNLCNGDICTPSSRLKVNYIDMGGSQDSSEQIGVTPPAAPPAIVIVPPVADPKPGRGDSDNNNDGDEDEEGGSHSDGSTGGSTDEVAPEPARLTPPGIPYIRWMSPRIKDATVEVGWDIWDSINGADTLTLTSNSPTGAVTTINQLPGSATTNSESDMIAGTFSIGLSEDGVHTFQIRACREDAEGNTACSRSSVVTVQKYTESATGGTGGTGGGDAVAPLPDSYNGLKSCYNVRIGETPSPECLTALRAENSFGGPYDPSKHTATYEPALGKKIIGYYAEWSIYDRAYFVKDIPAAKLTDIYYAFITPNEDGSLSVTESYPALEKNFATDTWQSDHKNKGNLKQLWLLKQKFPHLNLCFSVGGWTLSKNFYRIAASETLRNTFAQNSLDLLKKYNFDCIDIDWEFPVIGGVEKGTSADSANFTKLMQALYDKLNPAGKKLTAAVSSNDAGIKSLKYKDFLGLLDSIILMSYDFNGSWNRFTGHQSSLFANDFPARNYKTAYNPSWNIHGAVENIIDQFDTSADQLIARNKIAVGVGFYGRSWSGAPQAPVATQPIVAATGAGPGKFEDGINDYKEYAVSSTPNSGDSFTAADGTSWTYVWDNEAKAPMLYKANGGTFDVVTYTDRKAIYYQSCYAKHKAGGVIIWELSGDKLDSTHNLETGGHLLKQINKALRGDDFEDDTSINCASAPEKGATEATDTNPPSTVTGGSGFVSNIGSDKSSDTNVSNLISETEFNSMFPKRNGKKCIDNTRAIPCEDDSIGAIISYSNLIEAAKYYPEFANGPDQNKNKKELAAFLANTAHETSGSWGDFTFSTAINQHRFDHGFYFLEEVGAGSGGSTYCDSNNPRYGSKCGEGKSYHGRGPIQLSWNYNYGLLADMLGVDILSTPELILQDGTLAFRTALWFWMTPQPPKPSAHDVMQGNWTPSDSDRAGNRVADFGMTINIINGGLECGKGRQHDKLRSRIGYYYKFLNVLGHPVATNLSDSIFTTPNNNLDCSSMRPY